MRDDYGVRNRRDAPGGGAAGGAAAGAATGAGKIPNFSQLRGSGVARLPLRGGGKPEVRRSLPDRARPEPEPGFSLQIPWMAAEGKTGENPKIRETVGSRRGFRHSTRRSHQPGRQRKSGSNPGSDQPGGLQK